MEATENPARREALPGSSVELAWADEPEREGVPLPVERAEVTRVEPLAADDEAPAEPVTDGLGVAAGNAGYNDSLWRGVQLDEAGTTAV